MRVEFVVMAQTTSETNDVCMGIIGDIIRITRVIELCVLVNRQLTISFVVAVAVTQIRADRLPVADRKIARS